MAELVYILCVATSVLCATLLLRSWLRSRSKLLLWSMLCFVGLAVNSVLLLVDIWVVPSMDLRFLRTGTALVAMLLLLVGLIWESR